jgi:hypothetical protein
MLLAFLVAASASSVGVIVWLHFFADGGLPTRNRQPVARVRLAAFERKMAAWTRSAPFAPVSRPIGHVHRLRVLVAGFRGGPSRQTRAVHRDQLRFVGTIAHLRVHIRHGFQRVGQSPVGALPLFGQVHPTFLDLVSKFQVAAHPRETEMDGDPGPLGALDPDKPTQPLILPRRDRRPRRALDVNEQLQFGLGQTGPALPNGIGGKWADPATRIVPNVSHIKRTMARLDDQAAVRTRRPHRRAHRIKDDRTDPAFQ